MSKNILFRGQTRKKGEKVTMSGTPIPSNWVFGGIFPQNNGGDFAIIYQQDPEIQKFPVYAETVCQYTGKNDKYGGKIFENDIITYVANINASDVPCKGYAGKSWFDLAPCTPEFLACRLEPNRYEIHDFNTDTKRIKAYIQSQADRFLICDGKLYEETTEPMYVIMTFGLGCNHGGSALMIEDYYNSNIPSSRYYAANQREEAIAKAKEIALNRGDTESIHSIETAPLIHVYNDRFVTKNPQSWKAPGDEFCNTLEEITETAGDALAAGLMVICATAKSVKRG